MPPTRLKLTCAPSDRVHRNQPGALREVERLEGPGRRVIGIRLVIEDEGVAAAEIAAGVDCRLKTRTQPVGHGPFGLRLAGGIGERLRPQGAVT